jgi:RHS repeat-associated protein
VFGNLIIDNQPEANERITKIEWTVYGKIQRVQKHNGDLIEYSYDPSGNRIQKSVTSGGVTLVTYYVRDAQGNVMAVYESTNTSLTWKEQHLYGSSRLGVAVPNIVINSTQVLSNDSYAALGTDGFNNGVEGKRRYELSNHLGNVLITITDRKFWNGVQYESELITSQQYYAFGMLMPGMQFGASGNYRYGFNGKEKDNKDGVVQYDYGFRIYDPRLVRFKSVDPLTGSYPYFTPYQFASNNPIVILT